MANGEEMLELMKAADTDGSGTINYTEFIAATMDTSLYNREENLRTAFQMFDTDNSGKIDINEVTQLLGGEQFKESVDMDQVTNMIKEVDDNGDGEIDFEEFLVMMRKI